MFDWLYRLLGAMLSFFSGITGSYAVALLFYALIFKIVFLPFSVKQQKNQIAMARLTPKIEAIKAKYKGRNDQPTMQKQQQEIMELQQKEGYNPMSGCLPLLIQLPLIMLLYAVIQNPLSYIAKANTTLDSYNDLRTSESFNVEEFKAENKDFYENFSSLIDEKKEITQTGAILALYNDFFATTDGFEPADELPKNKEIELISKIANYISEATDEVDHAARLAEIESYGISYDSIPNFIHFGVNLAEQPDIKVIFTEKWLLSIIPIIAAAFSWLSMWLTKKLNSTGMPQGGDAQTQMSMKMMDLVMPLMTLFIAYGFSGMLGLYWIIQSALGLLQTFILSRVMPIPKFTEDEIRESLLDYAYTSSPDWALCTYGNEYIICGLAEDENGYVGEMFISEPISFERADVGDASIFVELYKEWVNR